MQVICVYCTCEKGRKGGMGEGASVHLVKNVAHLLDGLYGAMNGTSAECMGQPVYSTTYLLHGRGSGFQTT